MNEQIGEQKIKALSTEELAELDDLNSRSSLLNKLDKDIKPLNDSERLRLQELRTRDTRKTLLGRMAEATEKGEKWDPKEMKWKSRE